MTSKYRVKITRVAESDIREIHEFISRDNAEAATKWVEEIERQINSLESLPLRCRLIPEVPELGQEYRHLVYGNYRTIFRVEASKVVLIMRVLHGARLLDLRIFEGLA